MNNIYNKLCFNITIAKRNGLNYGMLLQTLFFTIGLSFVIFSLPSCKKLVKIGEPVNTITTAETFNSNENATSAITGIYYHMTSQIGPGFANGASTLYTGLSSDELSYFPNTTGIIDFQTNTLLPSNPLLKSNIWDNAYFNIYQANVVIEGLLASGSLTPSIQIQLLGEAKFLRAYSYFYLVNFFGDIPLITTSSYSSIMLTSRSSTKDIYQQIYSDLLDAKSSLPADFSTFGNERIRATKWAASALLARVYLYNKEWEKAESESSEILTSSLFNLESINNIFLKNSKEAIWQLQITKNTSPFVPQDGINFIPPNNTSAPVYFLTNQLLSSFESGDLRKLNWIDSTMYSGIKYKYPVKYKIRVGTPGNATQYYMMVRLAELYLIRAEARAKLNKIDVAVSDLNAIRIRSGLLGLSSQLSQQKVLDEIERERQVELFAEDGHRWFDLKRTDRANTVLASLKGSNWQSTDQLYPVPASELIVNPNLSQNEGYY